MRKRTENVSVANQILRAAEAVVVLMEVVGPVEVEDQRGHMEAVGHAVVVEQVEVEVVEDQAGKDQRVQREEKEAVVHAEAGVAEETTVHAEAEEAEV
ncbi:hypothetical protein V7124_16185, partial [Neobacillus niacini]